MKHIMFLITAAIMFIALLSFLPQEVVSKTGPRVIILSERNTVSLNMPIDGASASDVQNGLMNASAKLRNKEPIYLVLNSPGGSISDGEKIIETAKGLSNPIHTISIFSASMSFIISQYLEDRLILESGVMMSHRAYAGGLEGQVPGNLVTRALSLLDNIRQIDFDVAKRAGMDVLAYEELIRDELWMRGIRAKDYQFADEVVTIRCDKTLQGPGEPQQFSFGFFKVQVVFDKCPLITQPVSANIKGEATKEEKEEALLLVSDRLSYVRKYGVKRLVGHE